MKNLTEEEWGEIGSLTKRINDDLHNLILMSSKVVGTTRAGSLKRSSKYLNKFRSDAENYMFSRGIKDENVFYGDQS